MVREANLGLATEHEIRQKISDIRSALQAGPILPNIWGFYSPKNETLFTLLGDVTFVQAVLLEGESDVVSYSIQSEIDADEDPSYGRLLVALKYNNETEWYFCCRHESTKNATLTKFQTVLERERARAEKAGGRFFVRTEKDFASRMTEFWNWLALSTAITRTRDFNQEKEFSVLASHLEIHKTCSFHGAMSMPDVDPALMVAVVAKQIAFGLINCDLRNQPLNIGTEFWIGNVEKQTEIRRCSIKGDILESTRKENMLPRNRRTAGIPEAWRDIHIWPQPELQNLPDSSAYLRNKKAVEMYYANRDFDAIKQHTGLRKDWVRLLAKKCITPHGDGRIFGFRAVVRYARIRGYNRRSSLPHSNIHEGMKGGFAGAFTCLIESFPKLLDIIEKHVLQTQKKIGTRSLKARCRWVDLKDEILSFLRKSGLGDGDYPFNTRDQGYVTLSKFARACLYKKPLEFIKSRYGKDAARLAELRHGEPSLIEPNASFQMLEADFHKHDSAATVELTTPIGGVVDATVPRFWIGCAVDAFQRAILATTDSFEYQTTESCVLDLIDAAISPPGTIEELREFKGCEDGCWQPNQIFPQFAWHAWDIIKLDRALAHKSTNVLSKLISTVGCAVCFGRPRAWWARSIVERTFRELTARGAQRLSTTYGKNPSDPIRGKPELEAIAVKLRRAEICNLAKAIVREINSFVREGNHWESSLDVLKRSTDFAKYFPKPIPLQRKADRPTLWITILAKVEAYPAKGITPSLRVKGCRYQGRELDRAWSLVGERLIIEISRNDIRVARAINPRTGDLIGFVIPEKRWRSCQITWQDFSLLQKFGLIKRNHQRPGNVTSDFVEKRSKGLGVKITKHPRLNESNTQSSNEIPNGSIDDTCKTNEDFILENNQSADKMAKTNNNLMDSEEIIKLLGFATEIKSFSRE